MSPRKAIVAALAAALAGCAAMTSPVREAPALPDAWSAALPATSSATERELTEWWAQFGDATLTGFVERALVHNRDVREAVARIAETRALAASVDARAFPTVEASASAARDRISENNRIPLRGIRNAVGMYQAGFDASWELDIFGGIRNAREAAAADARRAQFDREAVGISVAAEVAAAYFRVRGAQARLASLDQQVDVARETIAIVEARVRAGLTSEIDLVRAKEILAALQARRPPLLGTVDVNSRRLGVLVGAQSGSLVEALAAPRALPAVANRLPATVPAQLLARRPDLRAVEQALEAEYARVGVAEADRYPRLGLNLAVGLLSLSTGNLATSSSALWNAGLAARAPVYDAGARDAQVAAARSRYDQAAIRYDHLAAKAVEEVESAALRYQREREHGNALTAVLAATEDARNLALARYQGGLGDFLSVLDAQRQLFAAEDEEVLSRELALAHMASLYKALGGGWKPAAYQVGSR